jgi:hypothetical protein
MRPGKYGPINVRFFNLTYFEVIINFKPIPRINYTLLYEEKYWVVIGPSYLNDESNSFFKEQYPFDLNNKYPNEMSILFEFQTSKITYNNSFLEIDLPDEIEINSGFDPGELDKIDPKDLYEYQAYFK